MGRMPRVRPGKRRRRDVVAAAPDLDLLRAVFRRRLGLVETLLLALLVFLAVRASFQNFKVDGNSMYPTLENGEFLIVNKLVYSEVDVEKLSRFLPFLDPGESPRRFVFHGPERGDIVVLRDPRQPGVDLIKRVIGLPGETVEIVEGHGTQRNAVIEFPNYEAALGYAKSVEGAITGQTIVVL